MRKLIVLAFVGLLAQLIDGSLGMAYGVTSSTLLLAAGVAPAAASAAVHFSEIGTSLVSGFSHHKLGNVDWRTVSILAVPGFVGAFAGATFLASLDGDTAKPWVAGILLGLGIYVIWRFLVLGGRRPTFKARPSAAFLAPMGVVGGALDAIGGGGWGPVGTTTLLSSGRLEPRKVDRLDRHLGVRGRGRRLARLPRRARLAGHRVGLRRRAARRRRDRRADRRLAGQEARGPGARRRGRRPDRGHQLQDHRRGARRLRHPGHRARVGAVRRCWIAGIVWAVKQERLSRRPRPLPTRATWPPPDLDAGSFDNAAAGNHY